MDFCSWKLKDPGFFKPSFLSVVQSGIRGLVKQLQYVSCNLMEVILINTTCVCLTRLAIRKELE